MSYKEIKFIFEFGMDASRPKGKQGCYGFMRQKLKK